MAERLAEIVCVRKNGRDPRTVVPMAPVSKQIEALPKTKKWPGQAVRPKLILRADSGAELDPKTGEPIQPFELEEKPEAAPNPAPTES